MVEQEIHSDYDWREDYDSEPGTATQKWKADPFAAGLL
jgi:hypothetical protein